MPPPQAPPEVSVVVPAYNAEALLGGALDAIAAQTAGVSAETIVVDDGSADGTAEAARRHPLAPRVVTQANAGSAAARNRGIAEARGRWVAFCDADDLWEPHKLERQLGAMGAAAWGYTDAWLVDAGTGRPLARWSGTHPMPSGRIAPALLRGNVVPLSSALVRRDVLEAAGGFPETLPGRASISEDWALWLRLAVAHEAAVVREPCVRIRQHPARKTETMDLDAAQEARLAIVADALARDPSLASGGAEARAAVYTTIGRKWLARGEGARARSAFARALRHRPLHLSALAYGAASLLPRSARQALGRLRGAAQARAASGEAPPAPEAPAGAPGTTA